ncbi:hypothetical protein TNCV_3302281 [Trichonephila clavipes]|nr:hypothetical protein TNCV_3302281 [Trichonephila clavipes]
MGPEVHEQMFRSGGQFDAKPLVLSSQQERADPRAADNQKKTPEIPGVNHVHSPAPSLSQAKLIFDLLVVKGPKPDGREVRIWAWGSKPDFAGVPRDVLRQGSTVPRSRA